MKLPSVTVIIPVYNVESVLGQVLVSLYRQTYPIQEIIIIDNHSSDKSIEVAKSFFAKHNAIPIKIIEREKMYGISDSYNLGAAHAKTKYIVTLHSDSLLPTKHELSKLLTPFIRDPSIVASAPYVIHRRKEWLKYPFWQKCVFARSVGKEVASGNGKFDCYRKDIFMKIHGYNTELFSAYIGAEDADMFRRLKKEGIVVVSKARVIHMHGFPGSFSWSQYIAQRRFLSITYGKYIRLYKNELGTDLLFFLIKPVLAIVSVLGMVHPLFLLPIFLFPFLYMPKMFTDPVTRWDIRNAGLLLTQWFLVFAESFWMVRGWKIRDARV